MSVAKDKKPKLNDKHAAKHFETHALTMPSDQVYRELVKNSIEACVKMKKIDPNFKGEIFITEDENFPDKFSIIDNGIGMRKDRITDLIINLAETEEESEDGNFGAGTKVAAFANNRKGIINSSLHHEENEGSRCQVYYNSENCYAVKYDEEENSCRISLDYDEMNPLIQKYGHGTSVTLFGNSENENTLRPPPNYSESSLLKDSRKDSVHWLLACINTKFFEIPDYIKIRVQVKRTDRTNHELVYGHKYYLDNYSETRGFMESPNAKFYWWVLSDADKRGSRNDCVLNGQLAFMHKKEVIRIDFNRRGMKCPLKNWNLNFAYKHVAVVIEPKGFQPNVQRTTLYKDKVEYVDYINEWKEFFVHHMPKPIQDLENKLQSEHAKKLRETDILDKKTAQYLKALTTLDTTGRELSDQEASILGGMKKPSMQTSSTKSDTDGSLQGPNFGNDPLKAGLKSKKGKKSRNVAPNPFPQFEVVDNLEDDEWVDYDFNNNRIFLNERCPLIEEYAKHAQKKSKGFSLEVVRDFTIAVFRDELSARIAVTKYRETHFSEEEKREALNNKSLTMILLDPVSIIDKIVDNFKYLDKKAKEFDDSDKINHEMEQTLPIPGIQ